ncbi:MAG TPA: M50 family metallopeptidase [Acidimicrobiia bacterium]|jgi:membrane-associated protease RseP (regulator of RpoE activity)
MIGGLIAVLAIALFVMAHEAGHFLAAKATGMKATEFFLGFGPKLWSFRRGETEYGIKAIPAGGYVRIIGMNPFEEVAPEDVGRTYREKPFWKKSVVVLAGVGMNFVMAFIMFFGVAMAAGIHEPVPMVADIVETRDGVPTAASNADIRIGDRIVAIDGTAYSSWTDIQEELSGRPGEDVILTIQRGEEYVDVPVTLGSFETDSGEVGFLGVEAAIRERPVGVGEGASLAGQEVWRNVQLTFQVMGELIRPESLMRLAGVFIGQTDVPEEIRPVSPIGIVNVGSQVGTLGVANYVAMLASINVILATFNVIPLLPLDGGHFAVALWQKITGREPDVRKLVPVAVAVIVLFTFLGLAAIILDIIDPIRL